MLENALVVKVAKDHVTAATRELMGDGWIVRKADLRTDPAILTVQHDPSLPRVGDDKAEQTRKRIEWVYGKELYRFSALPVGSVFMSVGDPCRLVKQSSTATRVIQSGIVMHKMVLPNELVERVL